MALNLYSQLIVKTDPRNLSNVQAELRKTFSSNGLNIDVVGSAGAKELEKALRGVRKEATGLTGEFQRLGGQVDNVLRRFSAYLIASGGILTTISLFKSAIGEAVKFQDELIKIKQVSGDSDKEVKKLGDSVGDLARKYGVSSAELIKSAVTLKQAGLTATQTRIAMEALAKTELAPNFDNLTKTTEGVIAIFQQFGKDATKLEGQLGSMSAVAGSFAAEASDLITVVQKAGGAAKASGANFEELLALFTSVRSTTRESADAISTGLRTIFGRLQRPDTIKFLHDLGIEMRYTKEEAEKLGNTDLYGKFVGPFEAIQRLSKGTAGMGQGSTLFTSIVEQVGGLRQLSRTIPLIQETAAQVEILNVAMAGKGSLDANVLQKQDSYLNKLTKIKEEFLSIGRALVESEGFDRFIQFLDGAARSAISLANALAPIIPYLAAFAGINIAGGMLKGLGLGVLGSFGRNNNTPPPGRGFSRGGIVPGPSMGDRTPAVLEGGEAVIPARSVKQHPGLVSELIMGNVKGFSDGYMPFRFKSDEAEEARIARLRAIERGKQARNNPQNTTSSGSTFRFAPSTESVLDYISPRTQLGLSAADVEKEKISRGYRSAITNRYSSTLGYGADWQAGQLSPYRMRLLEQQRLEEATKSPPIGFSNRPYQSVPSLGNNVFNQAGSLSYMVGPGLPSRDIMTGPLAGMVASSTSNASVSNMTKPSFRMSLPLLFNSQSYSKEQAYNLMATQLAAGNTGLTIPQLNAQANNYNNAQINANPYGTIGGAHLPNAYNSPYGLIGGAHLGTGIGGGGGVVGTTGAVGAGGLGSGGFNKNTVVGINSAGQPINALGQPVSVISRQSVLSSINNNRYLNGISSIGGFGAAAALGVWAGTSKDPATKTSAGTASIGATIGGTLGSLGGPIGTILGTGVGALLGWFIGAAQASKDLQTKLNKDKIDNSVQSLNESLEGLMTGNGSLEDLSKRLKDLKSATVAEAINKTREGGDFTKESDNLFKKTAGLQTSQIQRVLDAEIKKQAKAGQTLDLKSGPMADIIKNLRQLRPYGNIEKESVKLYDAVKNDELMKQANDRFVAEINKSVSSAASFADAINKATNEVNELDKNLRVISGGGYAGASFKPGDIGNLDKDSLRRLSGLGLSSLTSKVSNYDDIAKYLPDVLSRVIKPGEQNSDNLSAGLEEGFANISRNTGKTFNRGALANISDKLASMKGEDLFETMKKDPDKLSRDLLHAAEPALRALASIGKDLEERDKAYQEGLRHLLGLNDRANSLYEHRNSAQLQYLDMSRGFGLSNAGIDPSRVPTYANVSGQFNKEQDRLLGVAGIGENAGAISERISEQKKEIDTLRLKAKAEADGIDGSTKFRNALNDAEMRMANYNKALERLINTSERLAKLNEIIAAATKDKDAKLGLTDKLLGADPQELLRMQIQAQAINFATNKNVGIAGVYNNGLANYGPTGGAAAYNFTKEALTGTYRDVKIPSRFSENGMHLTGEEIWKKLLEEFNKTGVGAINAGPESARIKAAQEKAKDVQAQAGGNPMGPPAPNGIDTLIDNLKTNQNEFKVALVENNSAFFKKVDQYIAELQDKALGAERATKQTRLNDLELDYKGAKELQKRDITPEQIKNSIGAAKAAKDAQDALKEKQSTVGSAADQATEIIKKGFGKKNSKEILGELQGILGPGGLEAAKRMLPEDINDLTAQKKSELNSTGNPLEAARIKTLYDERIRRAKAAKLPAALRENIISGELASPEEEARKAINKVPINMRNLPDEAIKFGEKGGDARKTINEFEGTQDELSKLQQRQNINRIGAENKKVAPTLTDDEGFSGVGMTEGQRAKLFQDRVRKSIIDSTVPDTFNPSKRRDLPVIPGEKRFGPQAANGEFYGIGAGLIAAKSDVVTNPLYTGKAAEQAKNQETLNNGASALLDSFNRAGTIFDNFNKAFAQTLQGLQELAPKIEMTIEQKVELIINGAEVLKGIEPGMQAIASAAVNRGLEEVSKQLKNYNIKINV